MKRKLIALATWLPWTCVCSAMGTGAGADLRHKFRGIQGVTVALLGAVSEKKFITFTAENGRSLGAPGGALQKTKQISFYGGNELPIPKTVHVTWREGSVSREGKGAYPYSGGSVVGDYTIEVANRIPEEVLDSIRKDGGGLRIKFRLHDEGVLFGWDIERRPGYDPKAVDERGKPIHFPAEHFLAGGDFREVKLDNGKVVRKGWYIHPKTKERIETDF
jgi:hypothetical protein